MTASGSPIDGVVLRRAVAGDVGFLREMLYLALFVPPGAEPFHPEILDKPELARIVEGFGAEVGDAGWIAVMDSGKPLGAAWVRRFSVDAPGFGYVDDQTPELSIAVDVAARGCGIGAALLERLVADVDRISLSVDVRNPAVRLYERFGFVEVRRDGFSATMLRGG